MNQIYSAFKFSKNEKFQFFLSILLLLMARGTTLFQLSYAVDDYVFMLGDTLYKELLSTGRFGWVLIAKFCELVGGASPLTNTFYTIVSILVFAWAGVIVCRIWNLPDKNKLLCLCVSSVLILHPYHAELYTFKVCTIYISVALLLSLLSLYATSMALKPIVLTSLVFSCSLSIYQLQINYVFIVICLSVIIEISKQRGNRYINWKLLIADSKLIPRILTIFIGVILYVITNKIILNVMQLNPSNRAKFLPFNAVSSRLNEVYTSLVKILFIGEPVLPLTMKAIFIVVLLIALIMNMLQFIHSAEKSILFTVMMLMYISIFLGVFGVNIVSNGMWWPTPRALSGISIVWAGIVAILFISASNFNSEKIVLVPISVMLFGFIGINNHILTDQLRVNMRDLKKANRIIARLESERSFSDLRRIAVVGDKWAYHSALTTVQGDLNISAFGASWAKVKILNECSGYAFKEATPNEIISANEYCNNSPKWPDHDSVHIEGELAIVCQ